MLIATPAMSPSGLWVQGKHLGWGWAGSCLTFRYSSPGAQLPLGPAQPTWSALGQPGRGVVLRGTQPGPSWRSMLTAGMWPGWGKALWGPRELPGFPLRRKMTGFLQCPAHPQQGPALTLRMVENGEQCGLEPGPLLGLLFSHRHVHVTSSRPHAAAASQASSVQSEAGSDL